MRKYLAERKGGGRVRTIGEGISDRMSGGRETEPQANAWAAAAINPAVSHQPPNIVLVVLDCARAKSFSLSGGSRTARTPVIDGLAERGTSFPRAVAPSNWTLPSHVSLFTGMYPSEHGVRTYQRPSILHPTIAQHLRDSGYDTCLLSENPQLFGEFGLEHGFDFAQAPVGGDKVLGDVFGVKRGRSSLMFSPRAIALLARLPPLIAPIAWANRLEEVKFKRAACSDFMLSTFATWLGTRPGNRPFFAFFNFVDTHEPYRLVSEGARVSILDRAYLYSPRSHLFMVPGLQSRIRWEVALAGYLESIEQADRKIGRLIDILRLAHQYDQTLLVITADHGQAFGEMGNVLHGAGATDSVTRVPLVVSPPVGMKLPLRVERWVSLCEIHGWIRDAARGRIPFDLGGHSSATNSGLLSASGIVFSEGPPVSDANRSMKGLGRDQFWNHRLLAAYRDSEKFVLDTATGEVHRWETTHDPDESEPALVTGADARALRQTVFKPYEAAEALREAAAASRPSPSDVEIDQRLQSWGYV